MDNSTQTGSVLELTAPGGGVVGGSPYKIGSLVVVATASATAAASFNGIAKGVVNVPKPADEVWTENEKIYFDESEVKMTADSDTGANALVGVAVQPVVAAVVVTSDADPSDLLINGLVVTVLDYAALAGKTVSVTVGGTTTALLEAESGDWESETSNDATAANLAAAIDAIAGINDATAVAAVTTITPGTGASSVTPAIGSVRLDGVAR